MFYLNYQCSESPPSHLNYTSFMQLNAIPPEGCRVSVEGARLWLIGLLFSVCIFLPGFPKWTRGWHPSWPHIKVEFSKNTHHCSYPLIGRINININAWKRLRDVFFRHSFLGITGDSWHLLSTVYPTVIQKSVTLTDFHMNTSGQRSSGSVCRPLLASLSYCSFMTGPFIS